MANFTDPVANAKTIGFIYILLGIVALLGALTAPIQAVFGMVYLITGWGLRSLKIWAVYILGLFAILGLFLDGYNYTQGLGLSAFSLVVNLVGLALAAWFYSARSRFNN